MTVFVVTVNVADVVPAATVTDDGTVADELLLVRVTIAPPVGAALVSRTVPVTEVPPATLEALRPRDESVAVLDGFTVNPAVLLTD